MMLARTPNLFNKPSGEIFNPAQFVGVEIPEREWLVEGLVPHKTVTLLSGDGGLGKSLLMQQLATATAAGQDWLGLKTRKCNSFALFCEDSREELMRRQHSICKGADLSLEQCYGFHMISGTGIDPVLMEFSRSDAGNPTPFFNELLEMLDRMNVGLVIIDTAADTFAGDEIKRIQVRNFINRCLNRFVNELEASVILTSHPSRAGMADGSGLSGSTAWNNSVRSRIYLTRPTEAKDANLRVMQSKKSNYGSAEHEILVRWENGVFRAEENSITEPPHQKERVAQQAFLLALGALDKRGLKAVLHKNQTNYAPKVMASMSQTRRVSKTRLEVAQEQLLELGVVANAEDMSKPPSRRTHYLQVVDREAADKIIESILL